MPSLIRREIFSFASLELIFFLSSSFIRSRSSPLSVLSSATIFAAASSKLFQAALPKAWPAAVSRSTLVPGSAWLRPSMEGNPWAAKNWSFPVSALRNFTPSSVWTESPVRPSSSFTSLTTTLILLCAASTRVASLSSVLAIWPQICFNSTLTLSSTSAPSVLSR